MSTEERSRLLAELGTSGLYRHSYGYVHEEFLSELAGLRGIRTYREMADNDPVVGAELFAIEQVILSTSWNWQASSEKNSALRARDFFAGATEDMSHTLRDALSEALTMLPFGWAFMELVYKMRRGPEQQDPRFRSKFSDGLYGWRKWALRSQETLSRWEFDEEGGIKGLVQVAPPDFTERPIAIEKALLFRTRSNRNDPEGRALDPQTPIPTPSGWRRLDDLHPGDQVFDEMGRIRYVTARADWPDRPCYALQFADGSSIIADAEHLWLTMTLHERAVRGPGSVRTTADIVATLKTSRGISNHAIPWAKPLDRPHQALLMDPYLFGLWLGDGYSAGAEIACHAQDVEHVLEAVAAAGCTGTSVHNGPAGSLGRMVKVAGERPWDSSGPVVALRLLGVLHNKHIPDAYLRGSVAQRRGLLEGLMDSDGTVDRWGRCEFVNTNLRLVEGVAELIRSLGTGARVVLRHRPDATHTMQSWAVKFTPTRAPFRLGRKRARIKPVRARAAHYIVDARPVPPRRTICIEVDGPSRLFLAGEAMVPTHNSILRNAFRPWYYGKRIEEVEAIGIERDLAGLPVATPPADYDMLDTKNQGEVELVKHILRNIRRDEQEGILKPPGWELTLLSTGGRRQIDTDTVANRYNKLKAMTVLAQFMMLGMEKVGSFSLALTHEDLFLMAVQGWCGGIADTINRHAVPRLGGLNGIGVEDLPRLEPAAVREPKVAELGKYIADLVQAGVITTDEPLEDHLRAIAKLPQKAAAEVKRALKARLGKGKRQVGILDLEE